MPVFTWPFSVVMKCIGKQDGNHNNGSEDRTLVCYKEGVWADGTLAERACGFKCDNFLRSGQACGEQEPIMMLASQKMH